MASLLVRNVEDEIVRALKIRASQKGIGVEVENRNLLADALLTRRRRNFEEFVHWCRNREGSGRAFPFFGSSISGLQVYFPRGY